MSGQDLSQDALALGIGRSGWDRDMRYVADWGQWLRWQADSGLWIRDRQLLHVTQARQYLRHVAGDAVRQAASADHAAKQKATTQARTLRSARTVMDVVRLARANPKIAATVDQWDSDLDVIGTPAGVVDLRTGKIRPAVREDYITRVTATHPDARCPTPLWDAFLSDLTGGDVNIKLFLQRLGGYMLTGRTTEHRLPFIFGPGGNGKSVFANTLYHIMGEYAQRAPAETFLVSRSERHPTDLAGLAGARLVVSSELPAGCAWNESRLKDMTGGDPITAHYMRQDYFTYVPQFCLLMVGNHMPAIGSVDAAMRRRILLIPATRAVPASRRNLHLERDLRDEWPGILHWMIGGAVAWYRGGLQVPECIAVASDEYLDAEDVLGQFVAEALTSDPSGPGPRSSDVYQCYCRWMEAQGGRAMSNRALSQALRERGMPMTKGRDGRRLAGWRLVDVGPATWPAAGTRW